MSDYDFHQLSPHDLETLTRDLLQVELNIRFESFKTGKDQGIDLRYSRAQSRIIVQCKHYFRSGFPKLLRSLRTEKNKIRRLEPHRYMLVTSVALSPANKGKIVELFGTGLLVPSDVIGVDDLNNLIGRHPKIERKHFKLWLGSKEVLDRVLHNAEVTASDFKVSQVHGEIRKYVATRAHSKALAMLDKKGLVILSGPPGVGKTTLANLLLYEHVDREYQAIIINRDINEGLKLIQQGKRQIFYFDDFMGATFLGDRLSGVAGNEDKALLDFIEIVRTMPSARLILTTRDHIYSQALQKSERLRHAQLDDLRVLIKLSSYTLPQKAKILYNHIFFGKLPLEYRNEILKDRFYLKIIRHDKFNPRIIEWLSSYHRVKKVSVEQYCSFVQRLLNDPSEIWRHAYEQEISEASRSMLLALFSLGGKTDTTSLDLSFERLHRRRAEKYGYSTRADDHRFAFRELSGAFIKPIEADRVEVLDPSVLDLLNLVVLHDLENVLDIVSGAFYFRQFVWVWEFAKKEGHETVLQKVVSNGEQMVDSVESLMLTERKIRRKRIRGWIYDTSFERRLIILVEIADVIESTPLRAAITSLFDHCVERWRVQYADIHDLLDLLEILEQTSCLNRKAICERTLIIRREILEVIRDGCLAAELRDVIAAFRKLYQEDDFGRDALLDAVQAYTTDIFDDELGQIQLPNEYEELRDSLQFIGENLAMDITQLLDSVEEAENEFSERIEMAEDEIWDDWKDQWRADKATERSIIDMFSSLSGE